jgi:hypothetical protein
LRDRGRGWARIFEPAVPAEVVPFRRHGPGHAETAKQKAAEPLKPKVGQKPADEGLFGDRAYQTDLVDLAQALKGVAKRREPSAASGSL